MITLPRAWFLAIRPRPPTLVITADVEVVKGERDHDRKKSKEIMIAPCDVRRGDVASSSMAKRASIRSEKGRGFEMDLLMTEVAIIYGGDRSRRIVTPVDDAMIRAMGRVRRKLACTAKRRAVTLAAASRAMMALGVAVFLRIDDAAAAASGKAAA